MTKREPTETSIFDVVEKVERKPVREPVLPFKDWVELLKTKGELMVYVVYDKKDVEKFGFKSERMNKDVFLRSTVNSGLWKLLEHFKTPLYWASGKHKKNGCAVIVVSVEKRLLEHGFEARAIVKKKKKPKKVKGEPAPAPSEPSEPTQIEEPEEKELKIE